MSGLSRRASFQNRPSKPVPGLRFQLAMGMDRSFAKRKALQMARSKYPGCEFKVFEYNKRTGEAHAIRK